MTGHSYPETCQESIEDGVPRKHWRWGRGIVGFIHATTALEGDEVVKPTSRPSVTTGKSRYPLYCTRGWVDLGVGRDGHRKSHQHRDSTRFPVNRLHYSGRQNSNVSVNKISALNIVCTVRGVTLNLYNRSQFLVLIVGRIGWMWPSSV
jgi:hypothetical protein